MIGPPAPALAAGAAFCEAGFCDVAACGVRTMGDRPEARRPTIAPMTIGLFMPHSPRPPVSTGLKRPTRHARSHWLPLRTSAT